MRPGDGTDGAVKIKDFSLPLFTCGGKYVLLLPKKVSRQVRGKSCPLSYRTHSLDLSPSPPGFPFLVPTANALLFPDAPPMLLTSNPNVSTVHAAPLNASRSAVLGPTLSNGVRLGWHSCNRALAVEPMNAFTVRFVVVASSPSPCYADLLQYTHLPTLTSGSHRSGAPCNPPLPRGSALTGRGPSTNPIPMTHSSARQSRSPDPLTAISSFAVIKPPRPPLYIIYLVYV